MSQSFSSSDSGLQTDLNISKINNCNIIGKLVLWQLGKHEVTYILKFSVFLTLESEILKKLSSQTLLHLGDHMAQF